MSVIVTTVYKPRRHFSNVFSKTERMLPMKRETQRVFATAHLTENWSCEREIKFALENVHLVLFTSRGLTFNIPYASIQHVPLKMCNMSNEWWRRDTARRCDHIWDLNTSEHVSHKERRIWRSVQLATYYWHCSRGKEAVSRLKSTLTCAILPEACHEWRMVTICSDCAVKIHITLRKKRPRANSHYHLSIVSRRNQFEPLGTNLHANPQLLDRELRQIINFDQQTRAQKTSVMVNTWIMQHVAVRKMRLNRTPRPTQRSLSVSRSKMCMLLRIHLWNLHPEANPAIDTLSWIAKSRLGGDLYLNPHPNPQLLCRSCNK